MSISGATLMPDSIKERKVLYLQVISPIHIGTREGKLSSLEYLHVNGKTHLIDENRFGTFLKEKNLIDPFVEEAGEGPIAMKDFLKQHKHSDLEKVVSHITCLSIPGGSSGMREFRPFIRDGNGQLFIPGSSLKGALRTALLYDLIQNNKTVKSGIENNCKRALNDAPKKFFSTEWLQRELLQRFSLPSGEEGPHKDILRCLTVRDAYPVGKIESRIIKIRFLCKNGTASPTWYFKKKGGKDLEIWLEAVVNGCFRTELLWDVKLLNLFRKNGKQKIYPATCLQDVVEKASNTSREIFAHESGYYAMPQTAGNPHPGVAEANKTAAALARWHKEEVGQAIRIGFGSGMLSTTVNLSLPEELRKRIRDKFGIPRPDDPAPKSRRVWKRPDEQWLPMGWLKMTESMDRGDGTQAKTDPGSEAAPEKVQTERWDVATLSWDPGSQKITAEDRGKRAEVKGKDLVPESIQAKLFGKKKTARATVEVEPVGNAYRIVRIEPAD